MKTVPIELETLHEINQLLRELNGFDKSLPLSRVSRTFAARVPREDLQKISRKVENLLQNKR